MMPNYEFDSIQLEQKFASHVSASSFKMSINKANYSENGGKFCYNKELTQMLAPRKETRCAQ